MSTDKHHRRKAEGFNFTYIPENVAINFREALGCYSSSLLVAFSAMCRLTAQTVFEDTGDSRKRRALDDLDDIAADAGLDHLVVSKIRCIIFEDNSVNLPKAADIDKTTAAVLLEIMKDMLQQAYTRPGRLRQVLRMRQFFADPEEADETDPKISVLDRRRPPGTA